MTPNILLVSDLSSVGKVALSVNMPILSACQVETVPLPTCLLSSHTGGFTNLHKEDFTNGMEGFLDTWKKENISFSGVITGYFSNTKQIEQITNLVQNSNYDLVVDPIMADNGKLYKGFSDLHVDNLRKLCARANLILPNLTEACLLSQTPFLLKTYSPSSIEKLIKNLAQLTPAEIVLTGISFSDNEIGLAYYDRKRIYYFMAKRYPHHFFGSGDILASLLSAAYFKQIPLKNAIPFALEILDKSFNKTLKLGRDLKYGIAYEEQIHLIAQFFMEEKKGHL